MFLIHQYVPPLGHTRLVCSRWRILSAAYDTLFHNTLWQILFLRLFNSTHFLQLFSCSSNSLPLLVTIHIDYCWLCIVCGSSVYICVLNISVYSVLVFITLSCSVVARVSVSPDKAPCFRYICRSNAELSIWFRRSVSLRGTSSSFSCN